MDDGWKPRNEGAQHTDTAWPPQGNAVPQERGFPTNPQQTTMQPPQPVPMEEPENKPKLVSEKADVKMESAPTSAPEEVKQDSGPRPISPPPPGKPSGVMLALARLADLEAQMEYAYAKHMQLVNRQNELKLQVNVLSTLPVGIEAFKEELEVLNSDEGIYE
jgi:hypothetical protein